MRFKDTVTIIGAKRSKGEYQGVNYDSTKVYVIMNMDNTKGDLVGSACEEMSYGTSSNFESLRHVKFPAQFDAEFEMVTNGKSSKVILVSLKALPEVK